MRISISSRQSLGLQEFEDRTVKTKNNLAKLVTRPISVLPGHRVKHAQIETPAGVASVHLKTGSPFAVAKEAICHRLIDIAGLPVLPSFWVDYDQTTAFAVTSCAHGDLLFLVKSGHPSVATILTDWPMLARAAVFDELIANRDRNKGNLLWNGHGGFFLIDHEETMQAISFENSLFSVCLHQNKKLKLRTEAVDIGNLFNEKTINDAVAWGREFTGITKDETDKISEFLICRAGNITTLVDERILEVAADERNKINDNLPMP